VLLAGCGQGSSSGRVPRQDGAVDLGHGARPDGQSGPETGAQQDSAPDGGSTIDRASGPDQVADMWTSPDLSADQATSADLAGADTARAAADSVVEFPGADASVDGGCVLTNNISVASLPPISFLTYHDQPQIENYLQSVGSALPAIATYKVLGQSAQGRNLPYLIIDATCQASPPVIFANGTHHGDEPSSTESVLAIPGYLLRNSTTDASVRSLLQTYAFYVMPLVNPDGFALDTRENAAGLDINRDYSYPLRSDADSFKTVEAQLMKSLQESVGFHAAIAYHSGAQEVLWPWCYTSDVTADDSFFTTAGQKAAQAMNVAIYQQSYDDYPTQGEYIDFAYWRSHTLAATFEVSTDKAPSKDLLAGVVDGACKGMIAWVQAVNDHDKGSLHALPVTAAARRRFPLTAPFNGTDRLE
jgi:Zinc carboxypeptidase